MTSETIFFGLRKTACYIERKEAMKMVLMGMELELLIMDAYSLKDKRSVLKSIIDRMHSRFNVSAAEIDQNEMHNKGVIGFGIVSNNRTHAQKVLQQVHKEIEDLYPVEILHTEWMEY